jgi:hypothetical protein
MLAKRGYCLEPLSQLETARQERRVLLAGDKRLLREGSDVVSLSNQKGNYETLTKPRMNAI